MTTRPNLKTLDTMIDFAVEQILRAPEGYRGVVRELAHKWPDTTGLQIVFVLVSAAHAIENVLKQLQSDRDEAQHTLRVAALLSADLFALQRRANPSPTGQDLLHYWNEVDPYFLNL